MRPSYSHHKQEQYPLPSSLEPGFDETVLPQRGSEHCSKNHIYRFANPQMQAKQRPPIEFRQKMTSLYFLLKLHSILDFGTLSGSSGLYRRHTRQPKALYCQGECKSPRHAENAHRAQALSKPEARPSGFPSLKQLCNDHYSALSPWLLQPGLGSSPIDRTDHCAVSLLRGLAPHHPRPVSGRPGALPGTAPEPALVSTLFCSQVSMYS